MKEKRFNIKKLKKSPKEECFICNNKIAPEELIYKDNRVIIFLDLYPPTKGYTLVAFKKHLEDISDFKESDYLYFQKMLLKSSKAIKKALKPKGICLFQTGDLVPHFHFHVVPTYKKIHNNFLDIMLKKSIVELSKEEKEQISSKIKKFL